MSEPLFDRFDTFVAEREQEAERAAVILRAAAESAASVAEHADYTYAKQAVKARGTAILASTAASALQELAGVYELAAKVSESGMLEEHGP